MRVRAMSVSPLVVRQGATPSAAFAPTDLSGLVAWYDASKITGLADGAAVATWTDSSGNGYDLTQATAGFRPIYKVSIVNGRPVVRFDGTDDQLNNTSFADFPDAVTAVVVANYTNSTNHGLICATNNGTVNTGGFSLFVTAANHTARIVASGNKDATQAVSVGAFHIYANRWSASGGNVRHYIDGTAGTPTANVAAFTAVINQLHVGGLDSANIFPFLGDVAEIVIYDSELSQGNLDQVEAYYSTKYNITVA